MIIYDVANSNEIIIFLEDHHHKEVMVTAGGAVFSEQLPQPTKSSFTFDGKTWNSGIVSDLPEARAWHCLVKLDEDTLLAIGGLDEQLGATTTTYFYNRKKNEWTEGPKLNLPRY